MIVKEFEGKNENEAINKAIEFLGLNREDIDVEIVESKKAGFLWGGGKVKIRVHLDDDGESDKLTFPHIFHDPENDFERDMVDYLLGLIERTGLSAEVGIAYREDNKLGLNIETKDSGILIGKRGQTLEAIQLITNIVAGRMESGNMRVIVDTQNYRRRRERSLIRFAQQEAEHVRRTGQPRLLEAMNPFERRLIHTALSKTEDIETTSEGDGLYKRIRISYHRKKNINEE